MSIGDHFLSCTCLLSFACNPSSIFIRGISFGSPACELFIEGFPKILSCVLDFMEDELRVNQSTGCDVHFLWLVCWDLWRQLSAMITWSAQTPKWLSDGRPVSSILLFSEHTIWGPFPITVEISEWQFTWMIWHSRSATFLANAGALLPPGVSLMGKILL